MEPVAVPNVNTLCPLCGTYYQGPLGHICDHAAPESPPITTDHQSPPVPPTVGHLAVILANPSIALDTQIGGSHYKDQAIQPVEYIHANGLGFIEGSIVKYVTRWQAKGGVEDLKKVVQYALQLMALEAKKNEGNRP